MTTVVVVNINKDAARRRCGQNNDIADSNSIALHSVYVHIHIVVSLPTHTFLCGRMKGTKAKKKKNFGASSRQMKKKKETKCVENSIGLNSLAKVLLNEMK